MGTFWDDDPMISEVTSASKLDSATCMKRVRLAIVSAFLGCGFFNATWLVHVVGTKARLQITDGLLATALWFGAAGLFVGMILAAVIIAKLGGHKATWVSAVGLSMVTALPILSPTYPLLIPSLFCFGFFNGLLDGCMNSQAGHLQKRLGRPMMSSIHACWTIGNLIGAALGGALISVGIHPGIHFVIAWLLFVPVLGWMPRHLLVAEEPKSGMPLAIPHGNLILLGLISLFCMLAEGAIADWAGVFLREKLHATQGNSTWGYIGFFSFMFLARIVGDQTTMKLGVRRTAVSGLLLGVLGLLICTLIPNWIVVVTGFSLVGFGVATIVPLAFGAAAESRQGDVSRSVTAVASLGYVGLFSGPAVVGWISSMASLTVALQVVAGLLLLASMLSIRAFAVASASMTTSNERVRDIQI
jgi:MFS family permease